MSGIPTSIIANTSQEWKFTISEYPPSDGYAAEIVIREGTVTQTVNATDDGASTYTATIPAATTAGWAPNDYDLFVFATKAADRYLAYQSTLCVVADPSNANASSTVTQLETDLAAVDTAIRDIIAGGAAKSYSVQTVAGARQLERMTLEELRSHRGWLKDQIAVERKKQGKPTSGGYKRVLPKFS